MLRCPSDTGIVPPGQTHGVAITTYAAGEGFHWWSDNSNAAQGVFTKGIESRIADIRDGTSNTIMLAEVTVQGYVAGPHLTSGTGRVRNGGGESVFRAAFRYLASRGPVRWAGRAHSSTKALSPRGIAEESRV